MLDRVLLQSTIPIPCFGFGSPYTCSIQIEIATLESECKPLREKHRNSDGDMSNCKLRIPNINWNISSAFEISWGITEKYGPPVADLPNGYFIVQLKTVPRTHTKIWDNYALPPIYVSIFFSIFLFIVNLINLGRFVIIFPSKIGALHRKNQVICMERKTMLCCK